MNVFIQRLEAAIARRQGAKYGELTDAKCEVCGTNIHRYNGPYPGIICSTCFEPSGEDLCTRIMPLAITRSAIRE